MHIKQLYSQVRKTIKEYRMLSLGEKVLVCVSGGADSIFLLHALEYLKKEMKVFLHVVNIDHGLRAAESADESKFVRALCREKGIKCYSKKIIIKRERKRSLEEVAREKRYDFFKDTALKYGIKKIATAHNMNDQAETVLMRVIKGSSLKGLTGIPPVREEKLFTYIRPLLEIKKKDILVALEKERIDFKIDSSNNDEKFFRNAVRLKILPHLEQYNPNLVSALSRMADSLREDKQYIDNIKRPYIRIRHGKNKNEIRLMLKDIIVQPRTLQKEIVKDLLSRSGANIKKLSFEHWKKIRELFMHMSSGKTLDIPGHVTLEKTKKEVIIKRKNNACEQ